MFSTAIHPAFRQDYDLAGDTSLPHSDLPSLGLSSLVLNGRKAFL